MLERQQQIWRTTSARQKMYGSTADVGLHRIRRVIQRLLEAEAAASMMVVEDRPTVAPPVVLSGPKPIATPA